MYVVIRSKGRNWEVAKEYSAKTELLKSILSSFFQLCNRVVLEFSVFRDNV